MSVSLCLWWRHEYGDKSQLPKRHLDRFSHFAHHYGVQNGWTDRDAVWGAGSCWLKEPCIRWWSRPDVAAVTGDSRRCGLLPNHFGHLLLLLSSLSSSSAASASLAATVITGKVIVAVVQCIPVYWIPVVLQGFGWCAWKEVAVGVFIAFRQVH